MKKPLSARQVKRNIIFSLFAQTLSLAVSVILTLFLPKFLDEYQYAYWQVYVLYVGYVGILHFGVLDGLLLRYAQFDYQELNKPLVRSQFQLVFFLNLLTAVALIVASFFLFSDTMGGIARLVAVGIVTKNLFTYTSYTFQLTNRIGRYALAVISQRLFYGAAVVLLLLCGARNHVYFCAADLCGDLCGCVVGFVNNQELYCGFSTDAGSAFREYKKNALSGVVLMVSNWSSMLLTGVARMMIQWHWRELVFSKVSLGMSIANAALTFVGAVSVVLFPSLKRMEERQLPALYGSIRNALSTLFFSALLFYFPGSQLLSLWLPNYKDSLFYLGIFLPVIVFSSKVTLLTNNYLKAYRKERLLLRINLSSVIISAFLFAFAVYSMDNLILLLFLLVFAIMARSMMSEYFVMKIIGVSFANEFLIELLMTVLYFLILYFLPPLQAFGTYCLCLLVYFWFKRESLLPFFGRLFMK